MVTGNFDKPLGVAKPKQRASLLNARMILIMVSAIAIGAAGFALKGYVNPPDNNGKRPAQVLDTANDPPQADDIRIRKNEYTKRSDLPIELNAPGLQEIVIPDDDIATIIPRKRPENIVKQQILAHLPDPELLEKLNGFDLPVKSPDGLRPLDVYARQADTEGNFGVARIVIILGGLGISQSSTEMAIRTLPAGVTLAFAPYGNSLARWMHVARKQGHELLLQIPMEPFGYPQTTAGEHSLLTSVEKQENQIRLHWSLGRITNYVGVMNYLGGKMLSAPNHLTPVLEEISDRGLLFVDDGSVRNSMAPTIAKTTDLPFLRAHMTIDSLRTRSAISGKLKELEALAKRSGIAIGVATAFPDTISQISIFLKNAKRRGLELTPASAIASRPKG